MQGDGNYSPDDDDRGNADFSSNSSFYKRAVNPLN